MIRVYFQAYLWQWQPWRHNNMTSVPIPGAAMRILETTTWEIACCAAFDDSPNLLSFSSVIGIPCFSSLKMRRNRLINGMWLLEKCSHRDQYHQICRSQFILVSPLCTCSCLSLMTSLTAEQALHQTCLEGWWMSCNPTPGAVESLTN